MMRFAEQASSIVNQSYHQTSFSLFSMKPLSKPKSTRIVSMDERLLFAVIIIITVIIAHYNQPSRIACIPLESR